MAPDHRLLHEKHGLLSGRTIAIEGGQHWRQTVLYSFLWDATEAHRQLNKEVGLAAGLYEKSLQKSEVFCLGSQVARNTPCLVATFLEESFNAKSVDFYRSPPCIEQRSGPNFDL